MKSDFKIVFMGTPDFAVESLKKLVEENYNVVGVVTAPDKPAGRGRNVRCSAVKTYALEQDLNILQPENLKREDFLNDLKAIDAELFIVVAFRMLPESVWKMPVKGTINLHASLLPNYRGAAPINWAIINGESKTGVTTFFIQKEIDTGNIIQQKSITITEEMNAGELHDLLMNEGADLLAETVDAIMGNRVEAIPQNEVIIENDELRGAPKIFKPDCCINWSLDVRDVYNHIRGLSPYPGAWTKLIDIEGKTLLFKIYDVEVINGRHDADHGRILTDNKTYIYITTDGGMISLKRIQLEGKKRMNIEEFLRGYEIAEYSIVNS